MIPLRINCPHCKKSLLDDQNKIDDYPAVRVTIHHNDKKGDLLLSSIYGSYTQQQPFPIQPGDTITFFCPICNSSLMSTTICNKCNAKMVTMALAEGGGIQICSRQGCKKHVLEFEDLKTELKAFYNIYSTFFKG